MRGQGEREKGRRNTRRKWGGRKVGTREQEQ